MTEPWCAWALPLGTESGGMRPSRKTIWTNRECHAEAIEAFKADGVPMGPVVMSYVVTAGKKMKRYDESWVVRVPERDRRV